MARGRSLGGDSSTGACEEHKYGTGRGGSRRGIGGCRSLGGYMSLGGQESGRVQGPGRIQKPVRVKESGSGRRQFDMSLGWGQLNRSM